MVVNHLHDHHLRYCCPIDSAVIERRHQVVVRLKYEPVGSVERDGELPMSLAGQRVAAAWDCFHILECRCREQSRQPATEDLPALRPPATGAGGVGSAGTREFAVRPSNVNRSGSLTR